MTTAEQARLLEKARDGTAPDCANVDSFTIPLFIEQGVLAAARPAVHARRSCDDLFPYVRKVMTGPDGHIYAWWWSTDLRVLYRRTDLVPKAPRTWDELIAVRAGGREEGPEGRRLPLQRRPLGSDHVRQPRLLLDAGRRAARRHGRAGVRAGREPDGDAERLQARQAGDRHRRHAQPRHHVQHLRRMSTAAQGGTVAMFLGGSFQWPTMKELLGKEFEASGRSPSCRGRGRRDRDRHRRLVGGRVQQGPGEGRRVHGHRALDLRRRGQRADRRAADVAPAVRHARGVPGADLQAVPGVPRARAAAARPVDLPVALERDAGRDRGAC